MSGYFSAIYYAWWPVQVVEKGSHKCLRFQPFSYWRYEDGACDFLFGQIFFTINQGHIGKRWTIYWLNRRYYFFLYIKPQHLSFSDIKMNGCQREEHCFRLIFFYLYVQFTTFTWKGKFVPQKYVFTQGRNSHKFSKKHDYTNILVKKKGFIQIYYHYQQK